MIRIVTQKDAQELIKNLEDASYDLTVANARGKRGKVKIIFLIINKKELKRVIKIINKTNPKAFYSIEDIRYAQDNEFTPRNKTIFESSKFNFKKK